jgi:cardiolipin synthase C
VRSRTVLAATLVAGGAALGAFLGGRVARWVTASWVDASGLPPLEPWSPDMDLRRTFETFPEVEGDPPRLRLLDDNTRSWVARWRLLEDARRRIDFATFIVHGDVFGMAFLGRLLELARDGVRVRLLVDAHGTAMSRSITDEDILDELVGAGIETRVYRPMPSRIAQALLDLDPAAAVASEHDKIFIVDGRVGIVGGRNIGHEYFTALRADRRAFTDVDVIIEGRAACRALGRAFDAEWNAQASRDAGEDVSLSSRSAELLGAARAMDAWLTGDEAALAGDPDAAPFLEELRREHGALRGALSGPVEAADRAEVRLLDSAPRRIAFDDQITEGLRRLLGAARREVLIQSPYLVLSDEAVELLTAASERGVTLTIITNSPTSSDNAVSQAFFMEQWPHIVARVPGLRIFVRGDGHNLHGKTIVVDGQVAVVSTYNLDPISMSIDGELAVVAWSDDFARRVAAPVRRVIDQGAPTTYEYRIQRDADGAPLRDADGAPRIEFGPEQHTDPTRWKSLTAWLTTIRAMKEVGFDPVF